MRYPLAKNLPERVLACLLLLPVTLFADSLPSEDGPVGFNPPRYEEKPAWQEQPVVLPAWPHSEHLIELAVNNRGAPFETFIDSNSISVAEDGVVRFTSVQISSNGVWNVTYEGLHCGKRAYRRYAYGIREQWHLLHGSDWQRLTTEGTGRYRYVLYKYFMCRTAESRKDASQIVQKLRYPPSFIQE